MFAWRLHGIMTSKSSMFAKSEAATGYPSIDFGVSSWKKTKLDEKTKFSSPQLCILDWPR